MQHRRKIPAVVLLLGAGLIRTAFAQDAGSLDAAQANNPLANFTAFNIQNYYIGDLTEVDDNANQFWLRFAEPVSLGNTNWIVRASLPINTFPVGAGGSNETGLGDADIFAAYLIDTGNPAVSFGIGPDVVIPTASKNALGNDQWQLGLANVYFNAESAKFQYGYLLIYRAGVGDTNGRERVNLLAFQPFVMIQLRQGWYTGTAPIWNYSFENDNYGIPVGARIGKVFKRGNVVYNAFIEPQFSVADRGPGQPDWQIFAGFNMQF